MGASERRRLRRAVDGTVFDRPAHDIPLAEAPNINAAEMAPIATTSLAVSAATTVKITMPIKPMITGTLRLFTGEKPRCISRSAI